MSERTLSKIDEIGHDLFLAIGYGDSLGLPVETKSASYISRKYGEIRGLQPIENPYFGDAPAGTWSDDTQLSIAVAEALIEADGFSMDAITETHVRAMAETPVREHRGRPLGRGWGPTTRESVLRLKNGVSWRDSGDPQKEGNGVLMKLAPLALWQAVAQPDNPDQEIENFTKMTHANDTSVVCALVHRDILAKLLDELLEPHQILDEAVQLARAYEYQYPGSNVSSYLAELALNKKVSHEAILSVAKKGGFHAPETLVMAYGAFVLEHRFPECVYQAVKLGGDADSVCSIVAAMAVMRSGAVKMPDDIELLDQRQSLIDLGTRLVDSLS